MTYIHHGTPLILYDGTNADQIITALTIRVGDGILLLPNEPTIIRAEALLAINDPPPDQEG